MFLWEKLSQNIVHAIEQQTVTTSPVIQPRPVNTTKRPTNDELSKNVLSTPIKSSADKSYKLRDKRSYEKRREWGKSGESLPPLVGPEVRERTEKETVCELCGLRFPHPVTYHMKLMHPGCGWHAGGNGYNSGGNYCLGWAGNCGDGGGGGSSWYLLCDTCRDKYLKVSITAKIFLFQ